MDPFNRVYKSESFIRNAKVSGTSQTILQKPKFKARPKLRTKYTKLLTLSAHVKKTICSCTIGASTIKI